MVYAVLADIVVVLHLAFAVFAALGGLVVLWRPVLAWAHLPAVLWAAWVELAGRVCPLTPLEHVLRARAGESAYAGDFVAHYIMPMLYPQGLTRAMQIALGLAVLGVNVVLYAYLLIRRARRG